MGEEHVGREGKKDPCIPGNRCPSHLRPETGARQGVLQRLGMYLWKREDVEDGCKICRMPCHGRAKKDGHAMSCEI
jgi:hypothetical protein